MMDTHGSSEPPEVGYFFRPTGIVSAAWGWRLKKDVVSGPGYRIVRPLYGDVMSEMEIGPFGLTVRTRASPRRWRGQWMIDHAMPR